MDVTDDDLNSMRKLLMELHGPQYSPWRLTAAGQVDRGEDYEVWAEVACLIELHLVLDLPTQQSQERILLEAYTPERADRLQAAFLDITRMAYPGR